MFKDMPRKKIWDDARYYADREFLTGSMCRTYLRSPALFSKKYILDEIEDVPTPSMVLGSAVDKLLTEGDDSFSKSYIRRLERTCLKSEDKEQYQIESELIASQEASGAKILQPAQYDKAMLIAGAVGRTSAYKWLKDKANGPQSQVILFGKINGTKVKGKLDFLNISNEIAYVTDLKTSASVNARRYFWHASDMGYDVQMAMYAELVRQNYGSVRTVVSRHLAVSTGDWPEVRCFQFSLPMLKGGEARLLYAIDGIANCRFDDPDATWDDAETLGVTEDADDFASDDSET